MRSHWFVSMPDAQENLESWRSDYNEYRPYGAIGNNSRISPAFSDFVTSPNQIENSS